MGADTVQTRKSQLRLRRQKIEIKLDCKLTFIMTFPFLLLFSMLVSVTVSHHNDKPEPETKQDEDLMMFCGRLRYCNSQEPVAFRQQTARMKNSVIEALKRRIDEQNRRITAQERQMTAQNRQAITQNRQMEAQDRQIKDQNRQMTAQSEKIVALQTKFRLRDEELNKKI